MEVEEFAFDRLPALDEAEHADQQPAAGAQTEEFEWLESHIRRSH